MEPGLDDDKPRKRGDKKKNNQCTKKNLEDVLLHVYRNHIKIDKQERKNNNAILNSVLKVFLNKMRSCDKLFNSLKPKLAFLGSYFEGLRVGHATEYDINIILTLHLNYDEIKLNARGLQRGACTILKMPYQFRKLAKTPQTSNKGFNETEFWCDSLYRLSVKKFRSWMQRVIDSTLNTFPEENKMKILKINNKSYRIAAKISGPANTIIVIGSDNNIIDVDLVPTLEFTLPKKPLYSDVDFTRVASTNIKQYFVVPKPHDDDFCWRLAFPLQERYYIYDKQNMKPCIKILKLIRDALGFVKLASYYIKTVFLWESVDNPNREFWKDNSLSYLVLYMLKKVRDCLSSKTIRNFWCANHNLIDQISIDTCRNWANRLSRVINVIEQEKTNNPDILLKYLTKINVQT